MKKNSKRGRLSSETKPKNNSKKGIPPCQDKVCDLFWE